MNKHVPPPLKMKVERGRLVPATPYDAERLDSYRLGSTVNVRFTADRMRPLERKYRAILGKVIKECKTPWSNAEAAHQALKLACGYVNVGRTTSGEFMQWPRSLVDFEDKEMEDYFESVLAMLHRITGVDPETLKGEAASVGEDEEEDEPHDPETGEILPNESEASDAGGVHASGDGGSALPPEEPAGETVSTPAGSEPSLFGKWNYQGQDLINLREFAKKAFVEARKDGDIPPKLQFLGSMHLNYLDVMESDDARKALNSMNKALELVMNGDRNVDRIEAWFQTEFLAEG